MHVMLYGSYTRKPYRQATSGEIERMLSAPRLDHLLPARPRRRCLHRACWRGRGILARLARPPPPAAASAGSIAAEAAGLGRDAGKAAACWVFDGNTSEDAYRAVLRGIEDGDPAILGAHPAPGLSVGGGYTEADLAGDLGLDGEDQLPPDAVTAYLEAADRAFWHETERIAREHLAAAGAGLAGTGTEPGR